MEEICLVMARDRFLECYSYAHTSDYSEMFIIGTDRGVVVGSISCDLDLSPNSQSNTPKL